MSDHSNNRQLMLCVVCEEYERRGAVGSMCHSAHQWSPLGVCWTRHTGSDLDTVCCLVVDCARVLEIGEAIVRVQEYIESVWCSVRGRTWWGQGTGNGIKRDMQ